MTEEHLSTAKPASARAPAPMWRWGEPVEPLRRLLGRGGVLAIPTESSYGLAVDPKNSAGVERVYRVKERERGKPLPVVAGSVEDLAHLGIDPDLPILERLGCLWPGAVTVILPLARPLPASAGRRSLAVRIPDHPRLRRLLSELGTALTATSANKSGAAPVLTAREAAELLAGEDAWVVDDGRLAGGPPSTLIELGPSGIEILRAGRVPPERLRSLMEAPGGEKDLRERSKPVGES